MDELVKAIYETTEEHAKESPKEILMYFLDPFQVGDENGYVPRIARLQTHPEGKKTIEYFKTDWHWGENKDVARRCVQDKNKALGLTEAEMDEVSLFMPSTLRMRAIY